MYRGREFMKLINFKKLMKYFILSIIGLPFIILFQNCSQKGAITLTADFGSTALKVQADNTFYILQNSTSNHLKINLKKDPNNADVIAKIENTQKTPFTVTHGTLEEITDSSFIFTPDKDYLGPIDISLPINKKIEVPVETINATLEADGKAYISNKEMINILINVHDHLVPIPENKKKDPSEIVWINPVELDSVVPLAPFEIKTEAEFDSLDTTPLFSWQHGYDEDSGVNYYEVAIGSKPGNIDVVAWKKIDFANKAQINGKFELNKKYFISVRTVDFKGLASEAASNADWTVKQTFENFEFKDPALQSLNTTVTSNAVKLIGIAGVTQTAFCQDCLVSKNGGAFAAQAAGCMNGDILTIQTTSSPKSNTTKSPTVKIGSTISKPWTVTTTNLPILSIPASTDVNLNASVQTSPLTLSDFKAPLMLTLSGDGSPEFSIPSKGATWASTGTINPNDAIIIRMTSASTHSTEKKVSVVIGDGNPVIWSVKTFISASPFAFKNLTNVELNKEIVSDPITVTGFTRDLDVTLTSASKAQYSFDGVTWYSSGKQIKPNQTLYLKVLSSNSSKTETVVNVKIGETTGTPWIIKTTTPPDSFTIPPKIGLMVNTEVTSDAVAVTGFVGPVAFSLTGDGNPKLSYDGGKTWSSSGSIPALTQSLLFKQTSASVYATERKAQLTLAGLGQPIFWKVNTYSKVGNINESFMTAAEFNRLVSSPQICPSGSTFIDAVPVKIRGDGNPQFMINRNGSWTPLSTSGSIAPGECLKIQAQSASAFSEKRNAYVQFGIDSDPVIANWIFMTGKVPAGSNIKNSEVVDIQTNPESDDNLDLSGYYGTLNFTLSAKVVKGNIETALDNKVVQPLVDLGDGKWVSSGVLPADSASLKFKILTGTYAQAYYSSDFVVTLTVEGIKSFTWTVHTIPPYACAPISDSAMLLQVSKWLNNVSYDTGTECLSTFGIPDYVNTVNKYPGKLPKNAFVKVFSNDGSEGKTLPNDQCQAGKMNCSMDQRPPVYDAGENIISGYCRCN